MKSNLKKLRLDAGLTMQEMADKAGVVLSQVNKLESRRANPTMKTAFKVAKALKLKVLDIWEEE